MHKDIYIQSAQDDPSTDDVLSWIYYLDPDRTVTRLNDNRDVQRLCIFIGNESDGVVCSNEGGTELNGDKVASYWYRRGALKVPNRHLKSAGKRTNAAVNTIMNMEHSTIEEYMNFYFSSSYPAIGHYDDQFTNRLTNLLIAKRNGLNIPDTLVSNRVEEIVSFYDRNNGAVITKMIGSVPPLKFIEAGGYQVRAGIGTYMLTPADIEQIKMQYSGCLPAPTFFQQYIEKKIEIRVFCLGQKLYPMAIFSQNSAQTKLDYRNYDRQRPNRLVPYKLPTDIERKLTTAMADMRLNCGSIDLILRPDNEYVFLEVNPIGQYQWLARNCNYDIDRAIAKLLLCHDKTTD